MLCGSCGQENPENALYCTSCALPLLRCPSCGGEIRPQYVTCPQCGEALGEIAHDQKPMKDAAPAVPPPPHPAIAARTPATKAPGDLVAGRYRIVRPLGEGTYKKVFLAHDTLLARDVALQIIKSESMDRDDAERVRRECQLMARLGDRPHVVTIFDVEVDSGRLYIVTQFMPGGSLDDVLEEAEGHKLSVLAAITIAKDICRALDHAHSHGIVHRDLKPENIFFDADGRARLGDFGLAVIPDAPRRTDSGMIMGTALYMAPEIVNAGALAATAKSDLYSLGIVIYEMLTGRAPFEGTVAGVLSRHVSDDPPPPSQYRPDIPHLLEDLILRLLRKDPESRPSSAAAVLAELETTERSVEGSDSLRVEATDGSLRTVGIAAGAIPLIGRAAELAILKAAYEEASTGKGGLVLVAGEPGIGKSRLAYELERYVRARGGRVAKGQAGEAGTAPDFWAWNQIVRQITRQPSPSTPSTPHSEGTSLPSDELPQILTESGIWAAGVLAARSNPLSSSASQTRLETTEFADPEHERLRFFDAMSALIRRAALQTPLLIVLEDLHLADEPSLRLLQYFARTIDGSRILLLGTYRDTEVQRDHPLTSVLRDLSRTVDMRKVVLTKLSEEATGALIEACLGITPSKVLIETIYSTTEGNPFFTQEIARLLQERGEPTETEERTPSTKAKIHIVVPEGVREVVQQRLEGLSENCNKVLGMAAVAGQRFDTRIIASLAGIGHAEMLGILEEAEDKKLIEADPANPAIYKISQSLVSETIYSELPTARKTRLHLTLAEILQKPTGKGSDLPVEEIATHLLRAKPASDIEKTIEFARRAASRSTRRMAFETAVDFLARALDSLDVSDYEDENLKCELLIELAIAMWRSGRQLEARKRLAAAERLALSRSDGALLAKIVFAYTGPSGFVGALDDNRIARMANKALDLLPETPSATRARLLSYGRALMFAPEIASGKMTPEEAYEAANKRVCDAVEMAMEVGDPGALAHALYAYHFAWGGPELARS